MSTSTAAPLINQTLTDIARTLKLPGKGGKGLATFMGVSEGYLSKWRTGDPTLPKTGAATCDTSLQQFLEFAATFRGPEGSPTCGDDGVAGLPDEEVERLRREADRRGWLKDASFVDYLVGLVPGHASPWKSADNVPRPERQHFAALAEQLGMIEWSKLPLYAHLPPPAALRAALSGSGLDSEALGAAVKQALNHPPLAHRLVQLSNENAALRDARRTDAVFRGDGPNVFGFTDHFGNHFEELERCAEALHQRLAAMEGVSVEDGVVRPVDLSRALWAFLTKGGRCQINLEDGPHPGRIGRQLKRCWVHRDGDRYDRRILYLQRDLNPSTHTFALAVLVAKANGWMSTAEMRRGRSDIADWGEEDDIKVAAEIRKLVDAYAEQPAIRDAPEAVRDTLLESATIAARQYFAAAVALPHRQVLAYAVEKDYDIEAIRSKFNSSFEAVCLRLATLRGEGALPIHVLKVDAAGAIVKRWSGHVDEEKEKNAGSGIEIASMGIGCNRWGVYRALQTPDRIVTQISETEVGGVAVRYACLSRTTGGRRTSHSAEPVVFDAIGLGVRIEHARKMVYFKDLPASFCVQPGESMGKSKEPEPVVIKIGQCCHLCHREQCPTRAFPSAALSGPVRGAAG